MLLPLVDGIFPALVLAGALDSAVGIVQVGVLIFGGSAVLAIVLTEFNGSLKRRITPVVIVSVPLILLSGVEAAFAPTLATLIDLVIFERFAAIVILGIAASTASSRIAAYLPKPSVIILLGLLASFDPTGIEPVVTPDADLVLRGVAAGTVGCLFALAVAAIAPPLRRVVHVDRFRYGCAVALGIFPLSMLGVVPEHAPLIVLLVAMVFAVSNTSEIDGRIDRSDRMAAAQVEYNRDGESGNRIPEREPWL